MVVAVFRTDAELMVDAAATMFQNDIQNGPEPIAVIGVDARQPVACRAEQAAGRKTQLLADIRYRHNTIAGNIPVPDNIAGPRQSQRLALQVREQTVVMRTAGKGMLHHCKADQQND